jgi:hypothetical protein
MIACIAAGTRQMTVARSVASARSVLVGSKKGGIEIRAP